MGAIFLTESDVHQLMDMKSSIEIIEECFLQLHAGKATNNPRQRSYSPGIMLHSLSASAEYLNKVGWKNYTTTREASHFHVAVYNSVSGKMEALIEANYLGQLRTGAASGVATRFMTSDKVQTVGLFGAGKQAKTQLEAVCAVRNIQKVKVFCRNEKKRNQFTLKMSDQLNIPVEPVDSPEQAVKNQDIIITATTSKVPLFNGNDLKEEAHINAIGCNFWKKAEIDTTTITRSSQIVCDSILQCQKEAGDFRKAIESGILNWDKIQELADLVGGEPSLNRTSEQGLTLFKSVGLGLQDVAMGAEILKRAREKNIGQELPF
jgi:ornithine cyclodeaminase/alanine dehydrogenase-like protein (mu-crystallin family)